MHWIHKTCTYTYITYISRYILYTYYIYMYSIYTHTLTIYIYELYIYYILAIHMKTSISETTYCVNYEPLPSLSLTNH